MLSPDLLFCFQIKEVTKDSSTGLLTIHQKDKAALSGFDCLLWAIGRTPNTDNFGLESVVCHQILDQKDLL